MGPPQPSPRTRRDRNVKARLDVLFPQSLFLRGSAQSSKRRLSGGKPAEGQRQMPRADRETKTRYTSFSIHSCTEAYVGTCRTARPLGTVSDFYGTAVLLLFGRRGGFVGS